jgi:hypothetical protein
MKKARPVLFGAFVSMAAGAATWPAADAPPPVVRVWMPGGADCDAAAALSAVAYGGIAATSSGQVDVAALAPELASHPGILESLHHAATCGRVEPLSWKPYGGIERLGTARLAVAAGQAALAAGDPGEALARAEDAIRLGQDLQAGTLVDAAVGLTIESEGWTVAIDASHASADPDAAVAALLPLLDRHPALPYALSAEVAAIRQNIDRASWTDRVRYDPPWSGRAAFEADVQALPADLGAGEVLAAAAGWTGGGAMRGVVYMLRYLVVEGARVRTDAAARLAAVAVEA